LMESTYTMTAWQRQNSGRAIKRKAPAGAGARLLASEGMGLAASLAHLRNQIVNFRASKQPNTGFRGDGKAARKLDLSRNLIKKPRLTNTHSTRRGFQEPKNERNNNQEDSTANGSPVAEQPHPQQGENAVPDGSKPYKLPVPRVKS